MFLKNHTSKNEINFTLNKLIKFQGDVTKSWRIMKEVIGKARKTQPLLPRKVIISNMKINEQKQIVNEFINIFIDIGPELAKEIPRPARSF